MPKRRVMPLGPHVRTLWRGENMETGCGTILLARNVKASEGFGKYNYLFYQHAWLAFHAMFGRMARLPVDFNAYSDGDPDIKLQEFMDADTMGSFEREAKCQRTVEAITENIEQAQKKQKEYYDLKHSAATCFNVGLWSSRKTRKRRKGGKLDCRWEGPYVISTSLGKGLFKRQGTEWG